MMNVSKEDSHIRFALIATLIYALCVSFFSYHHEIWQDEAAFFMMATQHETFGAFLDAMRSNGHPPLFHIVIRFVHSIFPDPVVLKVVNLIICTAAIFLFLLKAPFSRLQKILFAGGALPFYIFSVVSRNYGLAMLLLFIVACLYKDRYQRPILFAVSLSLLAYVHSHMFIIVCAILLSMLFEMIFLRENLNDQNAKPIHLVVAGLMVITFLGMLIGLMTPNESSSIFTARILDLTSVVKAFGKAVVMPGAVFKRAFGFRSNLFVNIIIFGTLIYLLRKRHLALLFASGVVALAMFFILVYPSNVLRHQGSLYMLMIFVLWVNAIPSREDRIPVRFLDDIQKYMATNLNAFLTVILLIHVCMAYPWIRADLRKPYSSSKAVSAYLQTHPLYDKAILMGEPAGLLQALVYYIDNPVYFYRESRFGKLRSYKTTNNNHASLDDLLGAAQRIRKENDQEVLILIGPKIRPQGPYLIERGYGATFAYNANSLKAFHAATERIAGFHGSMMGEDCDIFRLK